MPALKKTLSTGLVLILCLFQVGFSPAQQTTPAVNDLNVRITQVDNSNFPSVAVYISVTDAKGEPVEVSPSQIMLEEDGKPITPDMIKSAGDVGPLTTMLVVDVSGSMNSNNKLQAAKAAAYAYVDQARPMDKIGLVVFNTDLDYIQPLTSNRQAVIDAVENLKARGDTAMYDALARAIDIMKEESGRVAIIVLTDGLDNRSKISPQEVLNRIGPGGLSISAIGLGDPTHSKGALSSLDEPALTALAEQAGGAYGYAEDESSLRNLYERLGRALQSEYVITYTSPIKLRDGVNRNLKVSLATRSGEPVGASVSPIQYNPGGLVPEVSQPAAWLWFLLLLGGLLLLLLLPWAIRMFFSSSRKNGGTTKNVKLGSRIKLKS